MYKTQYNNSLEVKYTDGQGYPPDFKVDVKIEDLIEGKDVVMEFALDRIKK